MSTATPTSRRTFLFTDIESSTRLWDQFPDRMLGALDLHDQLLRSAVAGAGGQILRHTGDGVVAVFDSATDAVRAALDGQRRLGAADWAGVEPLRVRMGVHSGEVVLRGGEHHGWALNFASRLHSLAHGGQVVVSGAAMADVDRGDLGDVAVVDLGLHRLRDVAQPIRVYTVHAGDLGERATGLRDAARRVATLPRPLTTFVGRSADLARVAAELERHPVVTLAGIAGTGKTRLALEVALAGASRFRDGVAMCELAGVEPAQVGVALARALGVERRSLRSPEESVVEWLQDRELLLVLDACEDAPEAIHDLVRQITQQCAGCRVLTTSHEPLLVEGEQVVRLLPLDVDDVDAEGVELFMQRAATAGADFPDPGRARATAWEVCRAVDGLPLAIEIAASNAASLALLDILDAVRAGELPGVAGGDDRRRSVADALDLTFGRLDDRARLAFTRCSVFAGSFDRTAFAVVALPGADGAEVLEVLRSLVDRSLITSETRRERTRFRLLEPVRAYAARRGEPGELEDARAAFLRHYTERAEEAGAALRGADEARWVSQVDLDFDNLRAAHRRGLLLDDADASLRIVDALWDFAFMRMRSEIFDWGEEAVAASTAHPLRSAVMGIVAMGGWLREHPAKATAFAEEAIRLEQATGAAASVPARMALMNSAEYGGAAVDVRALMLEVNAATAAAQLPYWQVNADVLRVLSYAFSGRAAQAAAMADSAMRTALQSENPSTIAWALFAKGMAAELDDADHAEALFEDALERSRSVENGWIGAMCSTRLASLRRRRGSWPDAMAMVAELIDTWERAGHRSHLWAAVRQSALCLADAGSAEPAATLLAASSTARLRSPQLPVEAAADEDCIERARSAADAHDWRRWTSRGSAMDQPQAVRLARDRMDDALARG